VLNKIINTDKYPIFSKGTDGYAKLTARCQSELKATGLCVLDGFVNPEALAKMCMEANRSEPLAFYNTVRGNAYLKDKDPSFPADHPINMEDETTLGAVAYDQIDPQDVIRQIYDSRQVLAFLGDALGRGEIFYYECPMGKINYSMMRDKDYLRWHFDQSDFVVSIPVQDCEGGGKYEYVYNIRDKEHENFAAVKKVLEGDRSNVKILNTPPGSLVLFEGRYTIHRVSHIQGPKIRIMALLGYADKPGVTSTDYLRKIRYGRTE
jgi:hypothetical protein